MEVFTTAQTDLLALPLDMPVPSQALQRRGAISFCSGGCLSTVPRFERRGGISFDKQDKNAIYVRMLGDVKVRTKPELARDYARYHERRRSSLLQEADLKMLEQVGYRQNRARCSLKFPSLHKVRRRQRCALRCSPDNASVLDEHYGGQATCLLAKVGDWDFNVFTLDKLTAGRSLFHMSLHLFQEHNLIETFHLDIVKIMRCFSLIEEGYHGSNPYHNAVHAADVAQAMHCFILENKLGNHLTPIERLAAVLSAITHDLDHPGVNQAFLIATSDPLAGLYKNTSVLENHHWRSAMGVFYESGIFDHFDQTTWNAIEWQLKSLILATDITRQEEFLTKLRKSLDDNPYGMQLAESATDRHFMLQIALKCADICNPCRNWETSKHWSEQVCDEFFKQGDLERQLKLDVTKLCDRQSTTVAEIQSKFMQFVVLPLFLEWQRFDPSVLSETMIRNVHINRSKWEHMVTQNTTVQIEPEPLSPPLSSPDELLDLDDEDKEPSASSCEVTESDTSEAVLDEVDSELLQEDEEEKENDEPDDLDSERRFDLSPLLEDPDHSGCFGRRHSLPPPVGPREGNPLFSRRGSFPHMFQGRRHSMPVNKVSCPICSFDKLAEKLASLSECSPTNGSRIFNFGSLASMTKLAKLSVSLDPTLLNSAALEGKKLTTAHGLDRSDGFLAQKQFSSEPQMTPPNVAQRNRSNSIVVDSEKKSRPLVSPGSDSTVDSPLKSCTFHSYGVGNRSCPHKSLATQRGALSIALPGCTSPRDSVLRPLDTNLKVKAGERGPSILSMGRSSTRPDCLPADLDTQPLLMNVGIPREVSGEDSKVSSEVSNSPSSTSHQAASTTAASPMTSEQIQVVALAANSCSSLEEEMPLLQGELSRYSQEQISVSKSSGGRKC